MNRFIFYITCFLFFISGCKSIESKNSDESSFKIELNSNVAAFSNDVELTLHYFKLGAVDVYVSNYTNVESNKSENFIKKRRSAFLNLFQDELNTYTGVTTQKSKCLYKQENESILFYSGEKNFWSDCLSKNTSLINKTLSTRIWKLCGNTIWEVTLKTNEISSLQFHCNQIKK